MTNFSLCCVVLCYFTRVARTALVHTQKRVRDNYAVRGCCAHRSAAVERVNPKKHPDYEGLVEIASYGNTSYKPFLFFHTSFQGDNHAAIP